MDTYQYYADHWQWYTVYLPLAATDADELKSLQALGRCDSYLQNMKLSLTDPLTRSLTQG